MVLLINFDILIDILIDLLIFFNFIFLKKNYLFIVFCFKKIFVSVFVNCNIISYLLV